MFLIRRHRSHILQIAPAFIKRADGLIDYKWRSVHAEIVLTEICGNVSFELPIKSEIRRIDDAYLLALTYCS